MFNNAYEINFTVNVNWQLAQWLVYQQNEQLAVNAIS